MQVLLVQPGVACGMIPPARVTLLLMLWEDSSGLFAGALVPVQEVDQAITGTSSGSPCLVPDGDFGQSRTFFFFFL